MNGDPCVTYLGTGSAGHFVKMVHNGIEYGIMQLIAETYDLMKRGLGLNNEQLRDVYQSWNEGELNSYLIEITSHIFGKIDEKTGKQLIDDILGVPSKMALVCGLRKVRWNCKYLFRPSIWPLQCATYRYL